ncbi:MAG: AAA family ATPase, partial [Bacteroidales bacterium]|nr:AAA family ATPase [Bacteroidales bacterium]
MFRRDIILDLQHWANRKNRKPLVLRGARQVGKTSVVQAFGNEFENYIYVNLEENLSK